MIIINIIANLLAASIALVELMASSMAGNRPENDTDDKDSI